MNKIPETSPEPLIFAEAIDTKRFAAMADMLLNLYEHDPLTGWKAMHALRRREKRLGRGETMGEELKIYPDLQRAFPVGVFDVIDRSLQHYMPMLHTVFDHYIAGTITGTITDTSTGQQYTITLQPKAQERDGG